MIAVSFIRGEDNDVGLKHFKELIGLRVLRLDGTRVTDSGWKMLRKALHNCRDDPVAFRNKL